MARVGPKGNITIPKHIRRENHICKGDEIEFLTHAGNVIMVHKSQDASKGIFSRFKLDANYAAAENRCRERGVSQDPPAVENAVVKEE